MATVILIISLIMVNTHSQLITCTTTDDSCQCPSTSSKPGETCILECATTDSCNNKTLSCRNGNPCEIRCSADGSCANSLNIEATTATDVKLICNGNNTCKPSSIVLHCGTGDCSLSCNGQNSCPQLKFIDISNTNSFQCIGDCPSTMSIPTISVYSPSIAPTVISRDHSIIEAVITNFPTALPTQSPILLDETTSSGDSMNPFSDSNINPHPLYYVIAVLLIFILILCIIIFCWVFKSHHRTQKLIAEQQSRLESKSGNNYSNNIAPPIQPSSFDELGVGKTSSLDICYGTDTVISPTPTIRSNLNNIVASPRIYRVKSHNIAIQHKQQPEESSDEETDISASGLSSNHLLEALQIQIKAEEEKDGEETTGQSSLDIVELMQHMMSMNVPHRSQKHSQSLPGEIIQCGPGHSVSYKCDYNNNNNNSSFDINIPPPPIMSHHVNNMENIENPGQSVINIPPPPPLNNNNNNNNKNNVIMPSAAYYGYTVALNRIHQLQKSLQNANIPLPPPPLPPRVPISTDKMQYLSPYHQEITETESRHSGISELSKHSTSSSIHINTSDIDSGEEDIDDTDNDEIDNDNDEILTVASNISNPLSAHLSPHLMIEITPDGLASEIDNKPIIELMEAKPNNNNNKNDNELIKDVISIPIKIDNINDADNDDDDIKEDSKTSKTYKSNTSSKEELSKTPIPNEYIDINDNNNDDQRRRSYAIQLVGGKDELTLTDRRSNSTVIEDTYLKYLNT